MPLRARPITILMADDDPDDRALTADAFAESRLANDLRFVEDGEQLMAYLRREGRYASPEASPWPGLILLDLNMPRKDGRDLRSARGQLPAGELGHGRLQGSRRFCLGSSAVFTITTVQVAL